MAKNEFKQRVLELLKDDEYKPMTVSEIEDVFELECDTGRCCFTNQFFRTAGKYTSCHVPQPVLYCLVDIFRHTNDANGKCSYGRY